MNPSAPTIRRGRLGGKVGVVISVLVGAFLVFDVAGKLAGVPQVKEGTAALGFPAGQALVMGIVLAVCVVVYAIRAPRCSGHLASRRISVEPSLPTCGSRRRCSAASCSPSISAC